MKPLRALTQYAEFIIRNLKKRMPAKDKKTLNFEEVKAFDKIGDLVESFKNLIQGLSG